MDGLSTLFAPPVSPSSAHSTRESAVREIHHSSSAPSRRPIQPIRRSEVPAQTSTVPHDNTVQPPPSLTFAPPGNAGARVDKLSSPDPSQILDSIMKSIDYLVEDQEKKRVLLILDAPDLLLASQSMQKTPSSFASSYTSLHSLILSLRLHEAVHSIVLNLSADINPPASTLPSNHIPSTLETESQAFLISLAHQANLMISCRGLDTGGAEDVSGIMRITEGGEDQVESDRIREQEWKEQELLYLVKNDGSARVWERSAGVG
jgi:elongator complex protein 6